MSYCVEKNEKISDAVRRTATAEVHAAIAELHSVPLKSKNIHEARRHLKKVRALLRLVRKQFPPTAFKKENKAFRDAGKMLSPIRDARVVRKSLASLKSSDGKIKPGFRFITLALQKDCDRRVIEKADLTKMTRLLQIALGRVKNWRLGNLKAREVRSALERSFRRCKKYFCKCLKTKRDESFHLLRKRVKDLEFHLCLFKVAWHKKAKCAWKEIKRLDDSLGEDHDLALLSERLRHFKFNNRELQNDYQKIVTAICERRTKLQKRAIKIGKVLFQEKPTVFVGRNIRL